GLRTFARAPLRGAAVGLVMLLTSVGDSLEDQSLDIRSKLQADGAPANVAVVGIDSKTFDPPNDEQWPFRRTRHAEVIDELREAGAKTVVQHVAISEQRQER